MQPSMAATTGSWPPSRSPPSPPPAPTRPGRPAGDLASTGLVIADKTPDGGAVGHVAAETAGFMSARHGADYDTFPENAPLWQTAQHAEGESVTTSRYP